MKHHRQNIIEFSESIKNAELSLWPSRYFLFCKSFVCCIIKVLLLEKIDFEDFLFPQNLYNMEAIGVCSIMDKENWGCTINLSTKLSLEIRRENDSLQWWNRNLPRDQLFHDLFLTVIILIEIPWSIFPDIKIVLKRWRHNGMYYFNYSINQSIISWPCMLSGKAY